MLVILPDKGTHLVAIRIKECFKIDYIWVGDEAHDLEFTVLSHNISTRHTIFRDRDDIP